MSAPRWFVSRWEWVGPGHVGEGEITLTPSGFRWKWVGPGAAGADRVRAQGVADNLPHAQAALRDAVRTRYPSEPRTWPPEDATGGPRDAS